MITIAHELLDHGINTKKMVVDFNLYSCSPYRIPAEEATVSAIEN